MTEHAMQPSGSGLLKTSVPVKVVAIERRRLRGDHVVIELPDGTRRTLHAGDVLVVHADVTLEAR